MKISVVIPVGPKHACHVIDLLSHLEMQTRPPDEVIVCAPKGDIPDKMIDGEMRSMFGFKFNATERTACRDMTAGANRNRGTEAATGDIVIYQDADDLPHPRRVELIELAFKMRCIKHLMHGFLYKHGEFPDIETQDVLPNLRPCMDPPSGGVTNGNVAIRRDIFGGEVLWPNEDMLGEDRAFNEIVYSQYAVINACQTYVLDLPLLLYRHDLSSFR